MKNILLKIIFLLSIFGYSQESKNELNLSSSQILNAKNLEELAGIALKKSNNKQEQLEILLNWTYYNISGDSDRFFNGGEPQNLEETIKKKKGLCVEYTLIFNEYCKLLNLKSLKIDGYVKPFNFQENDKLERENHAWNAVYIDQKWFLCDLFWATTSLNNDNVFINKVNKKYFLSTGDSFIEDHLPCDPIFQLLDNPIKIEAFTNLIEGYNKGFMKEDSINYNTEIENLLKLNNKNFRLKIARNTFKYNKDNPNLLIEELYNSSVEIVNNKLSNKAELNKAKNLFNEARLLIKLSNENDIKELESLCINGISIIEKRLKLN
jgi:transglutaminase/protease-like cytokinesis protein 3